MTAHAFAAEIAATAEPNRREDHYALPVELILTVALLLLENCNLSTTAFAARATNPSLADRVRLRLAFRNAGARPLEIGRLVDATCDVCGRKSAAEVEAALASLPA